MKKTGILTFTGDFPPDDQISIQKRNNDVSTSTANTNVSQNLVLDDWIYKPFTSPMPGAEGQQLVTMAMLPNLLQFGGDSREWSFKSMVHDVFNLDA